MQTVISAAIADPATKRMLLAQRCGATSYPFCWCTPGGKQEPNESEMETLVRELHEELGIGIDIEGRCKSHAIAYEYDIRSTRTRETIRVKCFIILAVHVVGDGICGDKTAGIGWFDAEELKTIRLAAADDANREALIRAISQ